MTRELKASLGPNKPFPQKVHGAYSPRIKSPGIEANHSRPFMSGNSERPELRFYKKAKAYSGLQCGSASYLKVG